MRVINTRTGLGWATHGGPPAPLLRPDTDTAHRQRQLQYVYFLETRWVKPRPVRATRVRLKAAHRVETDLDGETVAFYLDVTTHLPMRIDSVRTIVLKNPKRPERSVESRVTHELDGYHDVAGIQVPARLRRGGDSSDVRVELNPEYDPSIFTKPPSPDATADSWRNR